MSKIFAKLFPLEDYLYIFQLFEYNAVDVLRWFVKHPFARNLQRKHAIVYTQKAQLLTLGSIILQLLAAFGIAKLFLNSPLCSPPFLTLTQLIAIVVLFYLFQQIAPIFLVMTNVLLTPLAVYEKRRIIGTASKKLAALPHLTVVGICGSYGKTSTKDMLYTLLWKDFQVVKTPKSFNTPLSVAKTILSDLKVTTQVFIVEMDAYHPGEIAEVAQIVHPKFGLITAIGEQHLERFGTMESLAKTQFELAENLPADGKLFLNADNEWENKLQENYRNQKVFYGLSDKAAISADTIIQSEQSISFTLHTKNQSSNITLPLIGEHHVINFLAAASIALELGVSLDTIAERAAKILPTPHRLEITQQGSYTIIDNTYNTNPSAAEASLALLSEYKDRQKIIITPGMIELGEKFYAENKALAVKGSKIVDIFVLIGDNAKKPMLAGLKEADFPKERIYFAQSVPAAMKILRHVAQSNAVILLENDLPDQYF